MEKVYIFAHDYGVARMGPAFEKKMAKVYKGLDAPKRTKIYKEAKLMRDEVDACLNTMARVIHESGGVMETTP